MAKKIIIGVIAVLICSLTVVAVTSNMSGNSPAKKPASSEPRVATQTNNALSAPSHGAYLAYSEGVIEKAEGVKILFFHAPWCTQCQMVEKDIQSKGVPAGVSIIKIDYDTNHELRKKYGVTLQTTFVKVDAVGNFVKKFVAYDEPTFDSVQRELL